jgi:hypothetical protein
VAPHKLSNAWQQHLAVTVSPHSRKSTRSTILWFQKTVAMIFLTDGIAWDFHCVSTIMDAACLAFSWLQLHSFILCDMGICMTQIVICSGHAWASMSLLIINMSCHYWKHCATCTTLFMQKLNHIVYFNIWACFCLYSDCMTLWHGKTDDLPVPVTWWNLRSYVAMSHKPCYYIITRKYLVLCGS